MKEGSAAKVTLILSIVAATLALSAAVVKYAKQGDVNLALIGAGVFLLVFGFGAWMRVAR